MFEDHLVHTVEVRRRNGNTDRFGQPIEPTRTSPASATYVGRLTLGKPSERFTERTHDLVTSTHTLFLPLGSDVAEEDRITVRDESGNVLVDWANVTGVTTPRGFFGPHHIEVQLDATRSGIRSEQPS